MNIQSVAQLVAASTETPIWEVILTDELEQDTPEQREKSWNNMRRLWTVMQDSVKEYNPTQRSLSGLTGGDGARYESMLASGKMMCGNYLNQAIATALKISECNACMKRIVAAPTAGSCGVIPAVLLPYQQEYPDATETDMIQALYVSG